MLAVILGIDGAGKSTVAKRVARSLTEGGHPATVCWARWQPFMLRPVRAIVRVMALPPYAAGKDEPQDVSDLKAVAFGRWRLASRAYLMLALLDYWMQTIPRLLVLRRRSRVVVLDRYWYDLVIDAMGNAAAQSDLDANLARWWRHWFPAPDAVVLLDVDPSTAYVRKRGENPLAYLAERRARYAAVARTLGGYAIDAGSSIEDVCREVEHVLKSVMNDG